MKINLVAYLSCLRTLKQCEALHALGHDVHLFADPKNIGYWGTLANYPAYTGLSLFQSGDQLEYLLKKHSDADITYVHLPSDMHVLCARRAIGKKHPIVLDAHDWNSILAQDGGEVKDPEAQKLSLTLEDEAVKTSDLVAVPGTSYKKYGDEKWGIDSHVLYVCEPEYMIPTMEHLRLGGVVYSGDVDSNSIPSSFKFRAVDSMFKALQDRGINTHLYPTKPQGDYDRYRKLGVVVHNTFIEYMMLRELTRYDWAYCGSPVSCVAMDTCSPNKLWAAIGAGVPLLVHNAKEAGEFVEKHGYGIYLKGDEIKTADLSRERADTFRANLRKLDESGLREERHKWTMENQLGLLLDRIKDLGVDTKPSCKPLNKMPMVVPKESDEYDRRYAFEYNYSGYLPLAERTIKEMEKRVKPGEQVVDAGCGLGWFCDILHQHGYAVTGFDYSRYAVSSVQRLFPTTAVFWANIYEVKYPTPPAAVVFMEVLEHLDDDIKVVENVPVGTWVFFSVPYHQEVQDETHRRFYTEADVRNRFGDLLSIEINERALDKPPAGWDKPYPYLLVVGRRK